MRIALAHALPLAPIFRVRIRRDPGFNGRERRMSTRSVIVAEFQTVAREHDRTLAPLTDDLALMECGLDSLGFAVIVARLEDSLGVDPFSSDEDLQFPVTFGDFVGAYESRVRS
jgi:acyl carrier protein